MDVWQLMEKLAIRLYSGHKKVTGKTVRLWLISENLERAPVCPVV
jgi:hypothetical protein